MQLQVGMVVEGKVTGITKFGAFVTMPDGKSGLVHISEIANTFVNDVHDYVQEGQTVKVRVLSIADDGKINLSIKKAEEPAPGARPERRAPRAPLPLRGSTPPAARAFRPRTGPPATRASRIS